MWHSVFSISSESLFGTIHDPNRSTIVVLECSPFTQIAMTEDGSESTITETLNGTL